MSKDLLKNFRKKILIENNLCGNCMKPLDREGYYCTKCNDFMNKWKRENEKKRVENGLCAFCGKPVKANSKWYCKDCSEKANEYRRKRNDERKVLGLCVRCGKPADGKTNCRECLDRLKEYRIKTGRTKSRKIPVDSIEVVNNEQLCKERIWICNDKLHGYYCSISGERCKYTKENIIKCSFYKE